MLLWPRLGAYKKFPEGETCIWEQVLLSWYPAGRVEMVWKALRVPLAGSKLYPVTLEPCSLEK